MGQPARSPEWEFGRRLANDPRYFLETLTSVRDYKGTSDHVPFQFNTAQLGYYTDVWLRGIRQDIMGKSRKWGFSTQRVGLGLHTTLFSIGHTFRIVAHRSRTSEELNRTVKLLYESARKSLEALGLDPDQFIPRCKLDNKREYYFPETDSAVIVDTALGSGIGQSDRTDDLYITEYSEWANAEDKRAALVSSLPAAGSGRITIDFNAKGIGNDAYVQYQAGKREGESAWNGFTSVFYGVLECPEYYSPAFLESRRRDLRDKYPQWYPENDEEMWLKDDLACFDWSDIQHMPDNEGEPVRYLAEFMADTEIAALEVFHGVDASTGGGKSWQVCRTRALMGGVLWDVEAPVREKLPEHVFAEMAHERWKRWGGLMTVESNMAQATLLTLQSKGIPPKPAGARRAPAPFKGRRDPLNKGKARWGFNTNLASKKTAISDYQQLLADGAIKSPANSNILNEARTFEWKDGSQLAGAPDGVQFYDDEIMADLVLVQGMKRERPQARGGTRKW
jgi:hypothetical protein